MPNPIPHISIPEAEDPAESRRLTQNAINSLIDRINARLAPRTLDMEHQRISNLAWPVSLRDGVNVEYLKDAIRQFRRREPDTTSTDLQLDWCANIEDYDDTGGGAALSTITDGYTHPAVDVPAGWSVSLAEWVATLKTPCGTGGSLVVDILYSTDSATSWTSIYSTASYPTFQVDEVIISGSAFVQTELPRHTLLRGDIRVADGTAADLNFVLSGFKTQG
jgi:hypothetical protein